MAEQLEDYLGTIIEAIKSKQAAYFEANGKYWRPAKTFEPDGTKQRAVNEWSDAGVTLPLSEVAVSIATYNSPAGTGFTIRLEALVDGKLYRRSKSFGPNAADYEHARRLIFSEQVR